MPFLRRSDKKKKCSKSPKANKSVPNDDHLIAVKPKEKNEQDETPKLEDIEMSPDDIQEAFNLIKDIPDIASGVSGIIQNVTKKIENDELQMEKGLSFLDLKNLSMLNYITNLSYIILRKLNGKKIEDDPAVKRLAELRVVMEKMRPIENKMKYQINKLLACTSTENIDQNDPLKFRANPDNLLLQEGNEDDSEEADEEQKESKVYVPPKISATYYDEENILERKKKALEQAKKRALSSRMLNELRQEYDTGPEEIREKVDPYKLKLNEELQERERFEEDYMSRIPLTKRQRHDMRQLTTVTNFDTGFEDITALDSPSNNMQLKKKSKWKKGKFSSKNKKKGFKRKH